jgi:uncharacterized protein (TIGR02271 family)
MFLPASGTALAEPKDPSLKEHAVTVNRREPHIDAPHAAEISTSALRGDSQAAQRSETIIPVAREELDVHKRRVETDSGVRVRKSVQEREAVVDEPLERDEVRVERVRIGQPVERAPEVRYEGDTMIIPVLEEVLVVEKRLMLQEEVHVSRRRSTVCVPRRVTLRSEQARIERMGSNADELPVAQCVDDGGFAGGAAADSSEHSLIERKKRETQSLRDRLARDATDDPRS